MEWETLLVGAAVSAVVSAVVSLVAVHQVTVRRARAERADAALQTVKQLLEPLRVELERYRYLQPPDPKRTRERSHMDDHGQVVRILRVASDLSPIRARLVERRCRRVFGDYWVDMAIDLPSTGSGDTSSGSFSAWLAASIKEPGGIPEGKGPVDGLLHRAYCEPAGNALQDDLRRELRALAKAR